MAEGGSPRLKIHRGVEDAVHLAWNNDYDRAEEILTQKMESNPRFSLEFAVMHTVKGFLKQSNEQRTQMLDLFKKADGLATAAKYGQAMISDSSEEEDEDVALSAEADVADDLTEKDRKKIAKIRADAAKKQREKDKAEFKARAKEAKQAGQSLDQNWKLECDIIYADALLARSIAQLMMNSYLKGAINIRKTWGCYQSLMKLVEDDKDGQIPNELVMSIKFGCGTFYTYLALVPAKLMTLLSAIGFISDKELGEQYLTEVFQSGTIRAPLAALVLCTYYLFLPTGLGNVHETLARAEVVLKAMNERYPNNTHFFGYTNFFHRKRGETKEAVEAIEKATGNAERGGLVPLLLQYLHADTLFMDLQFANARDKYNLVLATVKQTKETFAYTGQVVLSLAACHVMLGEEAKALELLKTVNNVYNKESKNDANSPKYAARVLKDQRLLPMMGVYILYINRDLAHMKPENAKRLLEAFQKVTEGRDRSTPEAAGMYGLFTGVIQKGLGEKDKAVEEWEKVMASEKSMASDSMVMPYLCYEMGELEYRRGNMLKAKQMFEKGQAMKGEGHETLANRYTIALKQLRRAMNESK